jgi:hypothetical protein
MLQNYTSKESDSGNVVARYNYYLNSHRAEEYNLSTPRCVFKLNYPISLSNITNVFEVYVSRAMIPYTFYQFSSLRNSTTLSYYINNDPTLQSYTIPDGNYTILQLGALITSYTQAQLVSLGYTDAVVIFSYNPATNRLRFQLSCSTPLTLYIQESRLSVSLGFSSSWELSTLVTSITSNIDCNIAPLNMLYITSSSLLGTDSYEQLRSENTSTQIIAAIPLIHSSKYYIPFEPALPVRTRILSNTLSFVNFNIVDNFGDQVVNFPIAWSLVFTVEEIDIQHRFNLPAQIREGIEPTSIVSPEEPQVQKTGLETDMKLLEQSSFNKLNELRKRLRKSQSQLKNLQSKRIKYV